MSFPRFMKRRQRRSGRLWTGLSSTVATKLDRAEALLDELKAVFDSYWASDPLAPFQEKDPVTGADHIGYRLLKGTPDEFPLLVGDVVQNLRSALDHAVYEQTVRC